MILTRRSLGAAGLGVLAAPALRAQGSRAVRLVVGFAAGGSSDTMARLVAPRLGEFLGTTVVVENRTGAGGALAAGVVAAAPTDGTTLLFDAASFLVAQFIARSLPFDYETAFVPVGQVAEQPYVLAVGARTAIRDFAGYLDTARLSQDGMVYGSPNVGSIGHLAGTLLAHRSGLKMEHVSYRGGAEAARDLAAGTLPSAYLSGNSLNPLLESGRARAIALTTAERRGMPGVPTIAESGFPGFDLTSWNAVFCRAGTPEELRLRLEAAVDYATGDREVVSRLSAMGALRVAADAGALTRRLARERALLRDLIRDTGLSLG